MKIRIVMLPAGSYNPTNGDPSCGYRAEYWDTWRRKWMPVGREWFDIPEAALALLLEKFAPTQPTLEGEFSTLGEAENWLKVRTVTDKEIALRVHALRSHAYQQRHKTRSVSSCVSPLGGFSLVTSEAKGPWWRRLWWRLSRIWA